MRAGGERCRLIRAGIGTWEQATVEFSMSDFPVAGSDPCFQQRLADPGAEAGGALAGLGDFIRREGEAAFSAARGGHPQLIVGMAQGFGQMAEVVGHVLGREVQQAGDLLDRRGIVEQEVD